MSQQHSGWQLGIAVTGSCSAASSTLIGIVDTADVADSATVGSGLVLTILGGLALVGGSVLAVVRQR
jgi:hypothetical protein